MTRVYYPNARAILQVIFDGFGTSAQDTAPKIIPVLPKSVTVHKNSYRQADSWKLTFDALDLPIDPSLIRAGAVEIYLFQTDGLKAAQRVLDRKLTSINIPSYKARDMVDQIELDLKQAAAVDKFTRQTKPIVAGLFDEADLEMSSSGRWMSISGQDYTDHLIKIQYPPDKKGRARRIPTGRKVHVILAELLAEADPTGRLSVALRNIKAADVPVVGAREVRGNKRGIPVDSNTSYWDVMYKLATRHGLILFVDGIEVVLTRPQNIMDARTHNVTKFAWGHNIEHMNLKRHLGKQQVPQIIVQGYDLKKKKPVQAKYPLKADKSPTGLNVKRNEYQYVTAWGISDPKVLREMAKTAFHLLGRAERKITMKTRDLRDMRNDDILNLAAGDAVSVKFDPFNAETLQSMTVPERVRHLTDRGYGFAISQVIADSFQKLEMLSRPLRVREVTYEFSQDNGISIEMELQDFIVIGGDRLASNRISENESRGLAGQISDAGEPQ